MGQADPFGRGHARISDGRAWGLILHEVFGTFLARPKGLLNFLFLPEWLIHFTSYAGYPKARRSGQRSGSRTGDACTGQIEPQTERNLARR